jgi:hypothetical protein
LVRSSEQGSLRRFRELPTTRDDATDQPLTISPMKLLYDKADLPHASKLRDERFAWLQALGASELSEVPLDEPGFLFSYQHGDDEYRQLVGNRPRLCDQPEHRQELVCLDDVLRRLEERGIQIPTPKTWVIAVDDALPDDLTFPLFVRTPKSSWKRGGTQSRANSLKQLNDEMELPAPSRRRCLWSAAQVLERLAPASDGAD